ncbi:MAG: DUF2029 domain-containing protein [Candidatus Omnitrophica bacterium]|nr:DUF2029 domain-containing protein [Candidatus Omnitrophota bacterium]
MNEIEKENEREPQGVYRLLLGFLALLILYAFLKHAFIDPWTLHYEGGDFTIYYVAAERIADGDSPYPIGEIEDYEGEGASPIWGEYPYPPMLARLLVPLTGFSIFTAKRIYISIALVVFFALLWILYRMYKPLLKASDFLPVWASLFGWGPFIYSIRLGQCELLAMPFLALSWIFLLMGERRQSRKASLEILAGVAMGFAAMVRLTPILMIPVFLVTFRWRIALSFVVGSFLALLVSGPISSWEFFTQVLPTMSDVSEMRHCPSFHVLILRALDTVATWTGHPEGFGIDRPASILGTGIFYALVLGILFWRRLRFSTLDLFVIACFLPPLLAGKNPHHYTLALFPIIVGSVLVVREGLSEEAAIYRLRMILWVLVLLPALNYWAPANNLIDAIAAKGPISRTPLFILGNLVAFGLVVHLLDQKRFIHREKLETGPLQA